MRPALLIFLFLTFIFNVKSQTIILPKNDSTFIKEYREDKEFAIIAKDSFIIGIGNSIEKDSYGKFYQIKVLIQNMSDESYTFDPESISALLTDKKNNQIPLKVYSATGFQKKIRNQQTWAIILTGFADGFNAGKAGYQTSYVATRGYGGYTYLQPVTTYNAYAASQANTTAMTNMIIMSKQMEQDRKFRDEGYLKKATIHSGEGIYGYMNIKYKKGKSVLIKITINGREYFFNWDVSKKNNLKE